MKKFGLTIFFSLQILAIWAQTKTPEVESKPIMTVLEVITLIAIIVGPILAVQLEKYLERARESRNGKLWLFKTLMATRGSILSPAHVEALNKIDLEFYEKKKYQKVREAWKDYLKTLGERELLGQDVWLDKIGGLRADLLYEMGISLGYRFNKDTIKRDAYSPIGHTDYQNDHEIIRRNLLRVLTGESAIPVSMELTEVQIQALVLQIEVYKNLLLQNTSSQILSENDQKVD